MTANILSSLLGSAGKCIHGKLLAECELCQAKLQRWLADRIVDDMLTVLRPKRRLVHCAANHWWFGYAGEGCSAWLTGANECGLPGYA